MEHLVEIVGILAWPVTTLILVFSLRKPILKIIPQLSKFKFNELEMEFEKELKDLGERSRKTKTKIEIQLPHDQEEEDYLEEVKKSSPKGAIFESWLSLESTAFSTTEHFDLLPKNQREHFDLLPKNQRTTFRVALKALMDADVLTPENVSIINNLRTLRNMAAHQTNFTVTEKEAAAFIEVARDQAKIIASNSWQKFGGCSG